MDLPPVCEVADEAFEAAGLSGRFTTEFADLFTGPYLLRRGPGRRRAADHGSILNNDRWGTPFAVTMSLHMLVLCEPGARERTEDEYRALLEETGFRVEKLVRMDAQRDLLVARK